MSIEATERTVWQRMCSTPLRDVFRLRLTGRLDWQSKLGATSLSVSTQQFIEGLIKRTRLWRIEKGELVDELIAHFSDASEAGVLPDEAIEKFGDPRVAAKLMRRAKIRNRSLVWHAFKWFRRIAVAIVLFYAVLATIFVMGKPTISVDYTAILNAKNAPASPDIVAWPIYRDVWLKLGFASPTHYKMFDKTQPESAGLKSWVEQHQSEVAQLRLASTKSHLGFVYGRNGSVHDEQLFPALWHSGDQPPLDDISNILRDAVVSILIPHINLMRESARVLREDAAIAIEQGDGQRAMEDYLAIHRISKQLVDQDSFLVSELVALAIRDLGQNSFANAFADHPDLFTDAQLKQMAHLIAGPNVAADLLSYAGERKFIYDIAQRVYTDNGKGDGRLTAVGLEALRSVMSMKQSNAWPEQMMVPAGPGIMVVAMSRKEMLAEYEIRMARLEADLAKPLRDVEEPAFLEKGKYESLRSLPLDLLMPTGNRVAMMAERLMGERDGLEVAIACELFKRANGKYPERIDDLSPRYLPTVPLDRITGDPVKLVIRDGKPIVYSFGDDRDDDSGTPAHTKSGNPARHRAAQWIKASDGKPADGDWILFPPEADTP